MQGVGWTRRGLRMARTRSMGVTVDLQGLRSGSQGPRKKDDDQNPQVHEYGERFVMQIGHSAQKQGANTDTANLNLPAGRDGVFQDERSFVVGRWVTANRRVIVFLMRRQVNNKRMWGAFGKTCRPIPKKMGHTQRLEKELSAHDNQFLPQMIWEGQETLDAEQGPSAVWQMFTRRAPYRMTVLCTSADRKNQRVPDFFTLDGKYLTQIFIQPGPRWRRVTLLGHCSGDLAKERKIRE